VRLALAREGVSVTVLESEETIGGGTRTSELTVPGLLHDDCSAVHPMAVASPFLNSLDLKRHGLEWRWPEVDLAHPLDDGSAGVMLQAIDATTEGLGEDGAAWRRVFGSSSEHFEALLKDMLGPSSMCLTTPSAWPGSGSPPPRPRRCSPATGGRRRVVPCSGASRLTRSAH